MVSVNIDSSLEFSIATFPLVGKPTRPIVAIGITVGPKHHIPNGQIPIIGFVTALFMVNPMHLWPLNEPPQPPWSADVHVVEKFAHGGKDRHPGGPLHTESKKRIGDGPTQE